VKVQEVMTRDVSYCHPQTTAAAAAEIMWNRNCGALPIVEDGGRVVGMVTDRDLFIALGTRNQRPADLAVGDVMKRELSQCAPEDDVRQALETMAQRQLQRLPVVGKDGLLTGILSIDDLVVRAGTDGLSRDVLKTLKAICDRQTRRPVA
jgi:CBS domain-containing protein